jgi:predicted RNase H-like HicB family nuclease
VGGVTEQPAIRSAVKPQNQAQSRLSGVIAVEHMIQLHIEKLPEGVYLATSDEVQGLVAQGRTIQETIEIARDVAKKLLEAQTGPSSTQLKPAREVFDYPLIVAT